MWGVLAAPATVLAQLDAVRRIPARLVGLVVAALADFTSKRHSDTDVSAGHISSSGGVVTKKHLGAGREVRKE
jgi:hypothetical protein